MKVAEAKEYYGTKAEIARKLGLKRSTVTKWGEIVPIKWAWIIQRKSHGRVALRIGDYR